MKSLVNGGWWLLTLCGILEAAYAVLNLLTQAPNGTLSIRHYLGVNTAMLLCKLAMAAGACSIVAGLWPSSKSRNWLLLLNGAALFAFGLVPLFVYNRRVSFLPFAMMLVVVAVSMGGLAIRKHSAGFNFAATIAALFAVYFVVSGFGLIRLEPWAYFSSMTSFFLFSAACSLGVAVVRKDRRNWQSNAVKL